MHSSIQSVAVCGAGTMGAGIAQVAAQSGFKTILFDLNPSALEKAAALISETLQVLESKGRILPGEKEKTLNAISFTSNIEDCRANIVIEAIIEKYDAKIALFNQLAEYNNRHCIFASNTSSLSVTAIAEKLSYPERLIGMHFFNPAPVMKLVEIIHTVHTDPGIIKTASELSLQFGKTPVSCKDAPGFIVNRVARHYYLEALLMAEEGIADVETIDDLLVSVGFKMGPFRLMDLIGNDINLAVTHSLYEACGQPIRFRPSAIQQNKVSAGELGKKTGKGFYTYK